MLNPWSFPQREEDRGVMRQLLPRAKFLLLLTQESVRTASSPFGPPGLRARGMIFPLTAGGGLVGTLAIGRRKGDFEADELPAELLRVAAAFLSVPGASLSASEDDSRQANGDKRARDRSQDPTSAPAFSRSRRCRDLDWPEVGRVLDEIGGDFYDAVALSDRSLLLMIADVAWSKGVPAASLRPTCVRKVLRGLSVRTEDPAQLLNRLNRLLYAELFGGETCS